MLSLNIIPDDLKTEIKIFKIFTSVKNYFYIIIILLCVYASIFMVMKIMLSNHFNDTISRANFVLNKSEDNSTKIREINALITSAEKVQNDFVPWSILLSYLNKTVSDQITIKQLKLNKIDGTIYLAGNAKTRDTLLQLKNDIEKSPYFEKIDFPIKNLLEKENIMFEISAKIKSYEFE